MTKRSRAFRVISAVTAFSVFHTVVIPPITASAGPDDGKFVVTGHHIDSPKAFYLPELDQLKLRMEYADHQQVELADSLIWIGKGWGSRGAQYQLTLPDNDLFDSMGLNRNATYYTAPAVTWGAQDPVWWGFGADESLKMEPYRDGKVFLDLVDVHGPGRVEFFSFYDDAYPEGLHQILGSGENSPHSTILNFGQHTHNFSLFTAPGRYEIKYRISGRKKDDDSIAHSQVQTLVVQVGGKKPKETVTAPLMQRYQQAPAGDLASANYSFGVAPLANPEYDGDEHLDTFTFDAHNPEVTGTLTILVNGFHLTDLDVAGGKAQWSELMGPASADIQAVFIPANDKASRWITPVLKRTVDENFKVVPQEVDSTQAENELAPEKLDPKNSSQSLDEYVPAKDVTMQTTIKRAINDAYTVSFDFDDPKFRGLVEFKSEYGSRILFVENGHGEVTMDAYDLDGETYTIQAFPHSTVALSASNLANAGELSTPSYEDEEDAAPAAEIKLPAVTMKKLASSTVSEEPAPEPTPTAQFCEGRILLDHGHTDLLVNREDNALTMKISDQTGIEKSEFIDRDVSTVLGVAGKSAQKKHNASYAKQGLDFLDPQYLDADQKFYMLPETLDGQDNILWPGYNTGALDMADFKDGVHWHLEPISTPEGAQFGLYQNADLGRETNILVDSVAKDYVVDIDNASHVHMNWVFSKPGVYKFNTYFNAETADGTTITTKPETLAYVVGQEPGQECAAFQAATDNIPVEPSKAPEVAPSKTSESKTPEVTPSKTPEVTPSKTPELTPSKTSESKAPEVTPSKTSESKTPEGSVSDSVLGNYVYPVLAALAGILVAVLGITGLHGLLEGLRNILSRFH